MAEARPPAAFLSRRPAPRALLLFALAGAFSALRAEEAPKPTPPFGDGPPFDVRRATPHAIAMSVDTAAARDVLTLATGGEGAAAAIRRLRASRPVGLALARDGGDAEQFFGRLVATAAGTPDPVLSNYAASAGAFRTLLDALDTDGAAAAILEGRRIASLLPAEPVLARKLVVVPFFGLSGFSEVVPIPDGDSVYLVADVPRVAGDIRVGTPPREVVLKVFRAASAEGWRLLFANSRRWGTGGEDALDFETLLARTVTEGPATLFLFPDEFFPLASLLDEPISVSFARWNKAADLLTDPKTKEPARREALGEATRGEFWSRFAAIVGAQMTDAILRRYGTEAYLNALAAGPRSVATLYLNLLKGTKLPALGKGARKALEAPDKPAAAKEKLAP